MKELIKNITNPPEINHVIIAFYLRKLFKLSTMKHRSLRSRNVLQFHQGVQFV